MKSSTTESFRSRFRKLPPDVQSLARKNFKLWLRDPHHPSIQFKKVGRYWSARIGLDYRAVGLINKDTIRWFWIGPHGEYDRLIRG